MDPMTRWEAAALRRPGRRPQPGTGEPTIDLRPSPAAAPVSSSRTVPESEPEPSTLLVPLDAWNRMLNQLGNLHEAGRDLADARERAGRAETEAGFLRERVHDLRDRLEAAEAQLDAPAAPRSVREPPPAITSEADLARSTGYESTVGRRSFAGPGLVARTVRSSWRARRTPRR